MKIAVFGSAVGKSEHAAVIGKEIAKHGATIITGGCAGLPGDAASACIKAGGKHIGYSPGRDLKEHLEFGLPEIEGLVFIKKDFEFAGNRKVCLKYRNILSCADCDAAIIINGRIGTLNEFTLCYDFGKIIGILEGSGGCTQYLDDISKTANKKTGSRMIFEKDPKKLVEMIIDGTEQ